MNIFSIDTILEPVYGQYPENTKRPVIGITANSNGEDFYLRQLYCDQVVKAGGVPVLLTPVCGDNSLNILCQQLDMVDAIIFTGGGDHNPLWMNEQPHPELHSINPVRDKHELPLCRLAYNRHLPMLGICRGMQTIAVALDGHVAQDIKSTYPNLVGAVKHSQDAPRNEATHSVRLVEGTTLYNIYSSLQRGQGESLLYVNSFHHQAVDNCGPRFRASAYASDGVIEAMESTEHRQIIGVQWHPEHMEETGLPIFKWLVDEARISLQAKELHSKMITIDSHCDTPMFFHLGQGDSKEAPVDFLKRDSRILYDLHKMDEGHIDAVQMVCYLPQPKIGEKFSDKVTVPAELENVSPLSYTNYIFDRIEDICNRSQATGEAGCAIARTPADIARDKRDGRHSIVLGIENGLALEHDLRNIQYFKQRGITYITLCHNGDNDLCDSARGCNTHGGLSSFGRKAIAEMNRLGIMVDLSHAAETSFYQALEVSSTPIVCSHSNCRALCNHPRNLTDDQMRALAEAGGVMQLTLYGGFLNSTASAASIDDFMRHLEHAISIMGIDHVGIGTDFDGDGGVNGLRDASELINITKHLIRRRYSAQDIQKIWGKNWLRVMAKVQNKM